MGKMVKCINSFEDLTMGKIYEVLREDYDEDYGTDYLIIDDVGDEAWYNSDRFEDANPIKQVKCISDGEGLYKKITINKTYSVTDIDEYNGDYKILDDDNDRPYFYPSKLFKDLEDKQMTYDPNKEYNKLEMALILSQNPHLIAEDEDNNAVECEVADDGHKYIQWVDKMWKRELTTTIYPYEKWKIIDPTKRKLKQLSLAEVLFTMAHNPKYKESDAVSVVTGKSFEREFVDMSLSELEGKWTINGWYE
jgi:hypothetical protein